MVAYVLKVIQRIDGEPTEFDGQYVAAYDPAYCPTGEQYDGGLLLTVPDPVQAMHFASPTDALEKWRESYGIRPWDGRPNRPLTAFTCAVEFVL